MLVNIGDLTVSGFEVRADLFREEPINGGLSYAYAHATSDALGEDPLDFFPGHRAEAWIGGHYDRDAGAWLRAKYTGERGDNGVTLYDYVTFDAALWWSFDKVQLSLRADNILDQEYQQRSMVGGYGRTLFVGIEGVID